MATEPGIAPDVGRSPGTSLKQDESGVTQFEEQRENGLHKLTTVLPDGTVSRTIDRTDPQRGSRPRWNVTPMAGWREPSNGPAVRSKR